MSEERFRAFDFVQLAHSRRSVIWASVLGTLATLYSLFALVSALNAHEPWLQLATMGWPAVLLTWVARSIWRKGAPLMEVRGRSRLRREVSL